MMTTTMSVYPGDDMCHFSILMPKLKLFQTHKPCESKRRKNWEDRHQIYYEVSLNRGVCFFIPFKQL